MNTTVIPLLENVLGSSTSQNNELLFQCPFCHHRKKKLSINTITGKWHCWICNSKGGHILWLLKKLNLSKEQIAKFREVLGDEDIKIYKKTESNIVLQLPPEYKPLWKKDNSYAYLHALSYLNQRGFTIIDILRYKIGYCEKGAYAGRIIIPSYDENNQLNYFTGRLFYEQGMKYKNPPISKNVIVFENFVDWEQPIILCEGMFDAIALKQNAIPLMGKTLPKKLEQKLVEKKVKEVYIFLDIDAKKEALNMEQHLKQYNIDTKLVLTDGKDASEMGFEKSWEYILNSKSTNFTEFIKQRLFDK